MKIKEALEQRRVMTPKEFADKMLELANPPVFDMVASHEKADSLMMDVLLSLGYGEGVDIFIEMDKWYS